MSCASSNLANQDTNYYQNVNGYAVPSSIPYNRNINPNGCRRYKAGYPPFAPTIGSLSVTISGAGTYSLVYIYGTNFLPPCYGTTYVNFGPFKQLPITFYSTSSISFVVPLNAQVGIYKVVVVNIYNSNFSPAVNQSYSGNPNFSNPVSYQLIGYAINNGTYTITSNAQYNTIITFTANSSITFYQNYTVNYIIVGGGGGGGAGGGGLVILEYTGGGGGGGGEILYSSSIFSNTYNIIVGQGGNGGIGGGTTSGQNGSHGSISQISLGSNPIITANGGRGGIGSINTVCNGGACGSGTLGGVGGTSSNPNGITAPSGGGGGGGGHLYLGIGGNGSLNTSVPIYGNVFGAGGGGGSWDATQGNGGNLNAGNGGGAFSSPATSGKQNTGCGGGGGGNVNGGNGGSGIIIFYFNT